jgi:hypothetical protein
VWRIFVLASVFLSIGFGSGWVGRSFLSYPQEPVIEGLPFSTPIPAMSSYSNDRFHYAVSYPSDLLYPQGESDNGDGQLFLSKDAKARVTVFGSYNALENTLDTFFEDASRGGRSDEPNKVVTYKTMRDNWYVVSGFDNGAIFYSKRFLVGDQLVGFDIVYAEDQREIWDTVAAHINASFKPDVPSS